METNGVKVIEGVTLGMTQGDDVGLAIRQKSLLRESEEGICRADEALIVVECAGICRTDLYVADGRLAGAPGVVLGHEVVGHIAALGRGSLGEYSGTQIGDRVGVKPWISIDPPCRLGVEVDGAFATAMRIPLRLLVDIGCEVRAERAAYLEPVAAALGVLAAPFTKGTRSLIVGDGRIASLTARLIEHSGFPAPVVTSIEGDTHRSAFDIVIEAGLTSETLAFATRAVRAEGTIVIKSRSFDPVRLFGAALVEKSLRVIAPAYGSFEHASQLLSDESLHLEDLFGDTYALNDFKSAFAAARASEAKKTFLRPNAH